MHTTRTIFTTVCFLYAVQGIHNLKETRQQYLGRREELVEENNEQAFDHGIVLSDAEERVNQLLAEWRAVEVSQNQDPSLAAANFRTVQDKISKTHTYAALVKMPKGGLLHTHSIFDLDFLFQNATYRDECWLNVGEGTNKGMFGWSANGPPQVYDGYYNYYPRHHSKVAQDDLQLKKDYEADEWINVVKARTSSGNASAFDEKLKATMEFYTPDPNQVDEDDMWVYFDKTIGIAMSLASNVDVYRAASLNGFAKLSEDNLQHVEIRIGPGLLHDLNGNQYDVINETLALAQQYATENPESSFTMRLIYSIPRFANGTVMYQHLLDCVTRRRYQGEYLVGFDLVDQEDRYKTLLDYLDQFLAIADYIQEHGDPPLPYFFHAGETVFDFGKLENLYDAVLLHTQRIGHGFALHEFPALEKAVLRNDIAIEVCPISNQMLRLLDDLHDHPAQDLANIGIPITLSSDDGMIYGYDGVSYDYWEAYHAWNMTLAGLKQLGMNSLQYSALDVKSKEMQMTEYLSRWDSWISTLDPKQGAFEQ